MFAGVSFTDTMNGWISGGGSDIGGGIVGRTRDGGRTWTFQSGVGGHQEGFGLGQIFFHDSLRGCVVGGSGSILLTDDGGALWRWARNRTFASRAGVSCVQFLDIWNGVASGGGGLARTEDAGETWSEVPTEPESWYLTASVIHFTDTSRGWLVSHIGGLMRTADGGRTWRRVVLPTRPHERPTFRDLTFLGASRGWVVGDLGSIFRTVDGGESWALVDSGVPAVRVLPRGEKPRRNVLPELEVEPDRLALVSVRFADENRGWTVGYYEDVAESVVLGTRDGGATWQVEHVQRGELLRALCVVDSTHAWVAGDRAGTSPQVVLRYLPHGS